MISWEKIHRLGKLYIPVASLAVYMLLRIDYFNFSLLFLMNLGYILEKVFKVKGEYNSFTEKYIDSLKFITVILSAFTILIVILAKI